MQILGSVEFLSGIVIVLVIVVLILVYLVWKQIKENKRIKYPLWKYREGVETPSEGSLIQSETGDNVTAKYLQDFQVQQQRIFNESLLRGTDFVRDLEQQFRLIYDDFQRTVKDKMQLVVEESIHLEKRISDMEGDLERSQQQNNILQTERDRLRKEKTRIESRSETLIKEFESKLAGLKLHIDTLCDNLTKIRIASERDWSNIHRYFVNNSGQEFVDFFSWRTDIGIAGTERTPENLLKSINHSAENILSLLKAIPERITTLDDKRTQELIERRKILESKENDYQHRMQMKRGIKIVPNHYYQIVKEIMNKIEQSDPQDGEKQKMLYDLGIFTLDRLIDNFVLPELGDHV